MTAQTEKLHTKIGGMSCSFCSETIRKGVERLPGVRKVSVSLAHEEVLVEFSPEEITPERVKKRIVDLGYTVRDPTKVRTFEEEEAELREGRRKVYLAGAATAVAAGLMVAMGLGFRQPWFPWPMLALALFTMFGPGWTIKGMAWRTLRRGILNQHNLLEFGAFAGLAGGLVGFVNPVFPVPDFLAVSVLITTYHIGSGYASLRVRTHASRAVRKLLDLQPETARLLRDGQEVEVPVDEVQVGDRVRVVPGERIPLDGVVREGRSTVDKSHVTGESLPAGVGPGDEVIGGSLNQEGTLVFEVTRVGEASFLRQVARYVEEARALKPGILQLVDRVLKYYVPWVVAMAGGAVLFWTAGSFLLFGEANLVRALFAALAVLVMGYPCALGMATPLAMIRGGGLAAERGILMRSGEAFQALTRVDTVILDKTGTLTVGAPRVADVVPAPGWDRAGVLRLAASAEAHSEHPLGEAIVEAARGEGLEPEEVADFEAVTGQGVRGTLGGEEVLVGKLGYLESSGVDVSSLAEAQARLEAEAKTVVAVARGGEVAGVVALADLPKEDAEETVAALREMGLETVMVTGDNERTARAVAERLGIARVHAGVLPQEKAEIVRELQEGGHRVVMAGDGINDAPALMQADVGVAMGAGTDIAIESADVIVVGKRLRALTEAFRVGRVAYRKTRQNVTLAFAFNGVGVPAATTGLVHPVWAMVAMGASVTAVLLNSFGGRFLPARRPETRAEILRLRVPSIHCQGCVSRLDRGLRGLPGVQRVSTDLREKTVELVLEDAAAEEEVRRRILDLGHVIEG